MIPIHPQACPGRPDRLRWVTPSGVLPFTGAVAAAPPALAALLADGTLGEVHLETAAVLTVLGPGREWAQEGGRVRSALHAALDDPNGWSPANAPAAAPSPATPVSGTSSPGAPSPGGDEPLRSAARQLLDGELGRFAASHGGSIDLVGVRDGVVTVRLGGACHGCPAARQTLGRRLEDQLRRRCPDLRGVVDAGDPPGRRRLPLLTHRRA